MSGGQIQLFTQGAGSPIQWRLLAGNNREAGRGAQTFGRPDDCRQAIAELRVALDAWPAGSPRLDTRVRRAEANRWRWEVLVGEQVVAASEHQFDRMVRCRQGLDQFLAHLRDAEITPALLVFGARRFVRAVS